MEKFFLKDNENVMGYTQYDMKNNIVSLNVVFVEEAYRGQGVAKQLMDNFVVFVQKNKYKVNVICPYAAKYFKEHKEYTNLLND